MSLFAQRHLVLGSLTNTPPTPPTPVLPEWTIRCKFNAGYTPDMGLTQTLVDAGENVWDIYVGGDDWSSLFELCGDLLEVLGANTTGATDMSGMFYGCSGLTSVPLFDTSSVTGMRSMFSRCTSLTTVPLFDTSSVTDMHYMFSGCTSLTTVPLFDTSSATDMRYMFKVCVNVESGALALYQQASQQNPSPTDYDECFLDCGRDAPADAPIHAEMQQIPTSWGGLGE